ncbi:monooxygenase flavin-binding family protein-like protein [Lophiostoma macrostomum CBS 122681]|uniref:Monooxygenase flavin-binding family protein-like protein n=1 Tax=Lophiostoma macrostomum CBS 122681 TaxID=1314788 RepID=A0A6A6SL07_9PLEO|nr:monooxygenase flavin-binding family protein-like protein [Lophiostoma macrostomum CBS 122681]
MADSGSELFDTIIIGAGIAGLNTAYRIQSSFPNHKYAILESRASLGGTWDLFRYPGIRCDSPMHMFNFAWRPWTSDIAIASGADILKYLRESAAVTGIDQKIMYGHRLVRANWSSENAHWHLTVDTSGGQKQLYTRWIVICTGYYSYADPADIHIPGIENFAGRVIRPQFWPQDYDYANKHIAVIGSGATAVTLVPELAKKAAKVTMLQRSPTYIIPFPTISPISAALKHYLPAWLVSQIARLWGLLQTYFILKACKKNPSKWAGLMKQDMARQLPSRIPVDPHFLPKYNPWQQRLCIAPDGDFFEALRSGKADVFTDSIARVSGSGIELASGTTLQVDDIIVATGLRLEIAGNYQLSIDGEEFKIGGTFFWRSLMLKDVPNLGLMIGYSDQSWTVGIEIGAKVFCRVLSLMRKRGVTIAVPRMSEDEMRDIKKTELLDLTSTYVVEGLDQLPKGGDKQPWKPKESYMWDWWVARWANLEKGLELSGGGI